MCLILIFRKRICIQVNPSHGGQSHNTSTAGGVLPMAGITEKFKQLASYAGLTSPPGAGTRSSGHSPDDHLTGTGVIYELVSNIPSATEDIENRETLAIKAVEQSLKSTPTQSTADNLNSSSSSSVPAPPQQEAEVNFIEHYSRGVSALESLLQLDRLRQQVATKELLTTGVVSKKGAIPHSHSSQSHLSSSGDSAVRLTSAASTSSIQSSSSGTHHSNSNLHSSSGTSAAVTARKQNPFKLSDIPQE